MHVLCGQRISIRRESKWHREVVCPWGMVFCCTNSSSFLWCSILVLSGGPLLTPISGNSRFFSPSVTALLPMKLGKLVTSKFTGIWEFLSLLTTSDLWEIWLKFSWCGEPLSYAAQQISTLTEHWGRSSKAGQLGSTTCPSYPQKMVILIH